MKHFAYLLVFATAAFMACNDDTPDIKEENEPVILEKSGEVVVNASNNFAFEIFKELEREYTNENIFFSPLSMSMALSMALNGAVGETKQQIKNVIDFGDNTDEEINAAFKMLQDAFTTLDSEVEISLANSAWYEENYTLLNTYRNILTDYYYAEIAGLDFSNPTSVDIINDWIADKTNDKIKNMISELDPATILVLVNAIYFNGTWKYEFNKDDTYNGSFNGLNNEPLNCKIMQSGKLKTKFVINTEKSIATLPYGDGSFEMVLCMPTNGNDIQTVLSELNATALDKLLENATDDSVTIHLPKFKIETATISLKEMLMDMGMEIPFTTSANFSNIFDSDYGIYIDDVLHKAFIEVNEEGTEAAAATVVIFENTSIGGSDEKIIIFNNPFVFFIREVSTREILFAGKLIRPEL